MEIKSSFEALPRSNASRARGLAFDGTSQVLEAFFLVEIDGFERLNARDELRQRDSKEKITFLDDVGLF